MAGVYIVTGKLGNGKTLVTVGRIYDALCSGRRVATNLELYPRWMFGRKKRSLDIVRIPDKPTIRDMDMIGRGYTGKYDESKFGVLVLDECGTWFNSRNWQDKTRKEVNDWFLHARKLGWEVYLIIQDISILDSQAREALSEHTVFCRRLDNIRVPLIGGIVKTLTGIKLSFPKIHRAKVVYGQSTNDLVTDVWTYRGTNMYPWYDTEQIFSPTYPHGCYSMLTPWHIYGRHAVTMNRRNIMRITKIYWRRFRSPVALATGVLLGVSAAMLRFAEPAVAADRTAEVVSAHAPPGGKGESAIVAKLRDLYIAGFTEINGEYDHQLAANDGHGLTVYTTRQLAAMGFQVVVQGECRIDVTADGQLVPIYCM